MLSENSLEFLAQPIIERQEEINVYVLKKLAKQIKDIGELSPSSIDRLRFMLKSGDDAQLVNRALAQYSGLQEQEIQKLIYNIAKDAYIDAKPFYDYTVTPYIPFEENTPLQQIIQATARATSETYRNISNTRAFQLSYSSTPLSIADTYKHVTDRAIQAVTQNTVTYTEAIRSTIQELANSGLQQVVWRPDSDKPYTRRLDSAVRQTVLDGIRDINQKVQDEVGRQFGADAVEITVHQFPAPDHAPIQGHQFSKTEFDKLQNGKDFEDLNGNKFSGIERAIGMWNCRHFVFSIMQGASPNYTQEQLDNILKRNEAGYTLANGKHLTMYDCTQHQRSYELSIRKAKDGQIMAKAAGDNDLAIKYQKKINELTQQYTIFSKKCGLNIKGKNLYVSGYKSIKII